ncbi:bifunctional 4-hydroxy-2-oxoglutarate aldolase/2-dehydro-3-deoxy-phosphogluconate aldolase [Hydrotalea sp.]|uniref:bifunctional 4-hydroxy-2-oxoglutarate aldolase/2-dehydro-3-deoxy-phosphogluconate aldolase n=1 Tax=Hydrotalea sp. TaxID=2881279 RepID=UPI002623F62C|nr:bifunctional 4-hydroxy-2-oxoglutarate aldolase/2-dehydro-3-deoxy-phosphogluconate aldolase [Hydrotalea sp.]
MYNREQAAAIIKTQGILPLYYHADANISIAIAHALYKGGIRAIEFTNRGEKALENFKLLVNERNNKLPDLLLCIGTITTPQDAHLFIEAGANVLISPVFDADVSDVAYMSKVLWIPGCMTPTEIHVAYTAGWSLLKLFPGNVLQPHYIQAIKSLFPNIDFLVTGGVETNAENIQSWLKAGAVGVGLGSKLMIPSMIQENKMEALTQLVEGIMQIIHQFKQNK